MKPSSSSDDSMQNLEQIVAYLDGELSSEESVEVERQLASDEHYRQELQSIERAWKALDVLPVRTVDDNFSKTTMELVVKDAQREVEQRTLALPVQRKKRKLTTFLMMGTCALFGMLGFRVLWHDPNQQLRNNLPVIQYVDLYTQFESISFLESLQHELGDPPWMTESEAHTLETEIEEFQLVSSIKTRASWLDQRSPAEKASLRAKYNRFQGLPATEQQRLRELHKQVVEAEDEKKLLVLLHYHQWLKGVPAVGQYELRQQATPQARAQAAASRIEEQRKTAALELTEEQLRELTATVFRKILPVLRLHGNELSEQQRKELQNAEPERKLGTIIRLLNQHDKHELIEELLDVLPEDARHQLQELPPHEQQRQLRAWFMQARMLITHTGKKGEVLQEQLEEYFVEELPIEVQEELLALPREEMMFRLKQKYLGYSPQNDGHRYWEEGHRPPPYQGFGPPREGGRRRADGGPYGGRRMREGRGDPTGFGPRFLEEGGRPGPRRKPFEERPGRPPRDRRGDF